MLSFRRGAVAVFPMLLALAGCGFQPAFKADAPAAGLAGGFDVSVAGGREGFTLEELLEERLGPATETTPRRLSVSVQITERDHAVPGAGGIDRKALDGIARYQISAGENLPPVSQGAVSGSVAYSASKESVASMSARRDAETRLLTQIADRIHSRLIVTADEWSR